LPAFDFTPSTLTPRSCRAHGVDSSPGVPVRCVQRRRPPLLLQECKSQSLFTHSRSKLTSWQGNVHMNVGPPPQPAYYQNYYGSSSTFPPSDCEPPSSTYPLYVSNETFQQPMSPYYSSFPHSSPSYPSMNTFQGTWADATYNPLDRNDCRLGQYYDQSQHAALLHPVIEFLGSRGLSEGYDPFAGPSGFDNPHFNTQELGLPIDEPHPQNTDVSAECSTCGKIFRGVTAVKSLKSVDSSSLLADAYADM
jgi:hypothetical protein